MSSVEHHATVDKGLKMKIKRKNVGVDKSEKTKKDQSKNDVNKTENKTGESSQSANGMLADKTSKLSLLSEKQDKSPKSKSTLGKKDKGKGLCRSDCNTSGVGSSINGLENMFSPSSMEPKLGEMASAKRDCMPDPYEFNAKVEDGFSMPMKKLKLEKDKADMPSSSMSAMSQHQQQQQQQQQQQAQQQQQPSHSSQDVSTDTSDVAVATEPDCLGPCEPGTQVTLEGIVWHESENGVLVVNVTWRGKTYVGTLLDATRHDWAPPRLNCESPTGEFESRTPKGRGKRRVASATPVNDTRTLRKGRRGSTFTAPPSPAKSDNSTCGVKRKGRPQDIDLPSLEQRSSKRSRSGSQVPTPNSETPPTDAQGYIECPEPNCNKKYRHANGLKYHQSHAHSSSTCSSFDDAKEMDTEDLPLSVVKNSVKKEKEAKGKDSSIKKDTNGKDNGDKVDGNSATPKKSDREDKEASNDAKDSNNQSDIKCDISNSNSSKKKDTSNGGAKVALTQNIPPTSNSGFKTSQSSLSKSNSANNIALVASSSHGTVSASNNSVTPSASQPLSLSSSMPTSTFPTATSGIAHQDAFKNDNKLVDIKPKICTDMRKPNRPIVPAPSPQVLANVQVTHSNLSPVVSQTQMSPQLKPIQPKPTIMGERQNINPALADFNKDRKKVQKKKTKDGVQNNGMNNPRIEQPTVKIERTGVIKTNPMPNTKQSDSSKKENTGAKDNSRNASDSQRSQGHGQHPHKNLELHSRVNQNQNMLKVGSPLQVNTPDNQKTSVNDDVQSPAYSDISDANESASPAAPSDTSPQKQKEDISVKKEDKPAEPNTPKQSESQQMPHYGMYQYYGQSPYGMNNMSPGQKNVNASGNNTSTQNANQTPNKPSGKQTPNEEKKAPPQPNDVSRPGEKRPDDKDGNRPKIQPPPGAPGHPPNNMSPQQLHEYQMQQNWYQMYNFQSLPPHVQYQYMASGWYPHMDRAVMQQMMEEHRRAQGEGSRPGSEGGHGEGPQPGGPRPVELRGPDGKVIPGPIGAIPRKDDMHQGQRPLISPGQSGQSDKVTDDKSMKDMALREKQNENHQIIKENIDLKNEMEKRNEMERNRQEEMHRRKMYQEQKMIEERKKMEMARKGESRPDSVPSKAPGTKPIIEHSSRSLVPGSRHMEEGSRDLSGKRDSGIMDPKGKDTRDLHSRDGSANKYSEGMKPGEEKSKTPGPDKHNKSEPPHRNLEAPKHRPGGSSSKSGSPASSVNSSVPGSPSFSNSPFVNSYAPYLQAPQFIDPYRGPTVNPALIGSYPNTPYIHPSQMGFRPSAPEDDKDKTSAQKPALTPISGDSDLKKGEISSRGPYYGNMHKIHELSEKARPKSRNSSPGPVKTSESSNSSGSYDKHREYTNSPPTQRHVHTHHHTHVLQPGPAIPPAPGLQPPAFYDPYGGHDNGPRGLVPGSRW